MGSGRRRSSELPASLRSNSQKQPSKNKFNFTWIGDIVKQIRGALSYQNAEEARSIERQSEAAMKDRIHSLCSQPVENIDETYDESIEWDGVKDIAAKVNFDSSVNQGHSDNTGLASSEESGKSDTLRNDSEAGDSGGIDDTPQNKSSELQDSDFDNSLEFDGADEVECDDIDRELDEEIDAYSVDASLDSQYQDQDQDQDQDMNDFDLGFQAHEQSRDYEDSLPHDPDLETNEDYDTYMEPEEVIEPMIEAVDDNIWNADIIDKVAGSSDTSGGDDQTDFVDPNESEAQEYNAELSDMSIWEENGFESYEKSYASPGGNPEEPPSRSPTPHESSHESSRVSAPHDDVPYDQTYETAHELPPGSSPAPSEMEAPHPGMNTNKNYEHSKNIDGELTHSSTSPPKFQSHPTNPLSNYVGFLIAPGSSEHENSDNFGEESLGNVDGMDRSLENKLEQPMDDAILSGTENNEDAASLIKADNPSDKFKPSNENEYPDFRNSNTSWNLFSVGFTVTPAADNDDDDDDNNNNDDDNDPSVSLLENSRNSPANASEDVSIANDEPVDFEEEFNILAQTAHRLIENSCLFGGSQPIQRTPKSPEIMPLSAVREDPEIESERVTSLARSLFSESALFGGVAKKRSRDEAFDNDDADEHEQTRDTNTVPEETNEVIGLNSDRELAELPYPDAPLPKRTAMRKARTTKPKSSGKANATKDRKQSVTERHRPMTRSMLRALEAAKAAKAESKEEETVVDQTESRSDKDDGNEPPRKRRTRRR